MRVAYLCGDPGVPFGAPKGAAVHMAELVEALAREGAEVLVLVADLAPGATPPPGVSVERLPGPGKGASALEQLRAEAERRAWLSKRLRRFGADLLYERLALHSAAGSKAAGSLSIPHFVELNAPLLDEAGRYRRLEERDAAERREHAVLAGADLVLAVSRPLASYAERRGARRVEVLPNAVAIERHPGRPARRTRDPVAIFVGRVRPWHGIEVVLEAWRLLGPAAPWLVVAGEAGDYGPTLEESAAQLAGALSYTEVPALMAKADIGLAPYAADAPTYFCPLKLFEYMAAGLAVVAADLPAVREAVSPETAVLVPKGDPEALAAAVARLSADPELRERLGRAARAFVAEEHTWAHRARHVLAAGELRRALGPALGRVGG